MVKFFYILLILLYVGPFLQAQNLTLANAIELAKERNLRIQTNKKRSQASEHNYKAEKFNYLPTVSVVGGFTHLGEELRIDMSSVQASFVDGLANQNVNTIDLVKQSVGGSPLTPGQRETLYNSSATTLNNLYPDFDARVAYQDYFMAGVTVTQPIFMGGKLKGLNSVAASEYAISKQIYQQTSDIVIQRAIIQYFTVVLFEDVVKARKASVKAMEKHEFNTTKLVEQEIIPSYHKLGAQAALAGANTKLTLAENDLETALSAYKNLLNIPTDTTIILSSDFKYVAFQLEEKQSAERSLAYSPILKINSQNQQIANTNTSIAKSGYLPNIFAIGEVQLYQQNLPVITPPWMVGVQMKWDIYSGNKHVNRTRAAKLMEEQTSMASTLIANDINLAIKNSYNKAKNSRTIYESETKTYELMEASFNAIQKQYIHGFMKSSEVVDAQLLVDDAHLAQLTSLYTYYIALVELYKLRGELNEFVTLYEETN